MTTSTLIQLSPEELQQTITNAVTQALAALPQPASQTKLLLTVEEAAEQIGYSPRTMREFIRQGRQTRKGETVRLPVLEITNNEYRIRPDDLTNWISYF